MSNNNIEKKTNKNVVEEWRGGYATNEGGFNNNNLSNAGLWGGGYGKYNHVDNYSDIGYHSGWYNGSYYNRNNYNDINWSPLYWNN